MPQVWITYEELGDYYAVSPQTARKIAQSQMWGRRRSHDGHTRVRLPPNLAIAYMTSFISQAAINSANDLNFSLVKVKSQMNGPSVPQRAIEEAA